MHKKRDEEGDGDVWQTALLLTCCIHTYIIAIAVAAAAAAAASATAAGGSSAAALQSCVFCYCFALTRF